MLCLQGGNPLAPGDDMEFLWARYTLAPLPPGPMANACHNILSDYDGQSIRWRDTSGKRLGMWGNEPMHFKHEVIDSRGPENPHIKAVGDVNRDGFVDIVVASSEGGPLVWYEYPNWTKHVIAQSGGWSTDGKLADVDGDGDLDIIVSEWYVHKRLEWYENPLPEGNPATDRWRRHLIGDTRAHNIEVIDIDRDGFLEIVTRQQAREGNEIIVWKWDHADSWARRVIHCPIGEGLAVGDIDGDGGPDIVIGGRWYDVPRDIMGEPWDEHGFADWTPDAVVGLAEMNEDGRIDVVLTRSEGHYRLSWFEAPPDPKSGWIEHWAGGRDSGWIEHVVDDSVDFAHSLAIGDMDDDGHPDIVTAEMHQSPRKRIMIYLNDGSATEWRRQIIAETGSHNLCIADIGNDGMLDLIGANWSGDYQPVEIWRQI